MKARLARLLLFVESSPGCTLFFCALLLGVGYGLGHERSVVPSPDWLTPARYRFCLALMAWTALMQPAATQMLAWSATDALVLSLPFFAGVLFAPTLPFNELVAYELAVGKFSAGAVLGVAVCQALLSMLPAFGRSRHSQPSSAFTP